MSDSVRDAFEKIAKKHLAELHEHWQGRGQKPSLVAFINDLEQATFTQPREFEEWYFDNWSHGETTAVHHAHKNGCAMAWRAATAAADAEWRGVVEKLVEKLVEAFGRVRPILSTSVTSFGVKNGREVIDEALAQAQQLLGRK